MDHPVYVVAYGLGFASGTFLGITIEQRLAFGQQLASLVTRKGVELAKALRMAGYRVAEVKGHTGDGKLTILYVEIPRRQAQKLITEASAFRDSCFCIVNDVRMARFRVSRQSVGESKTYPDLTLKRYLKIRCATDGRRTPLGSWFLVKEFADYSWTMR
jgi:hypothetical protein